MTINYDDLQEPFNQFSTLVELLRYRASTQPERIAYIFLRNGETEEARLTYGELDQNARAIAAHLQSLEAKGERGLLLYPPGLDFISAFFGCLYAEVVAIPAYPPRRNQNLFRLQAIIADSQARFTFTNAALFPTLENQWAKDSELAEMQWVVTDEIDHHLSANWQEPTLEKNTLAFLQYTSGSTGTPKGVMVSHHNLLINSAFIDHVWGHDQDSVMVTWLPTFHDMGLIYGVIQPLYKGFLCYMMAPANFVERPLRWLQALSDKKATHSAAPNFAYDLCVRKIPPEKRATLDLSHWRMTLNGSEPVRAEVLKKFAEAFQVSGFKATALCPGYGLAEATLVVTAVSYDSPSYFYPVQANALEKNKIVGATETDSNVQTLVGCGWTTIDTQIVIVNPETLKPCSPEIVGEIWVSGSTIAQGYWGKPQETQETFQSYLADTGAGPFLRTGDLGFIKDGELFVTGRLKEIILIRGRNNYPQDIEYTVQNSHPALRPSCGAAFTVENKGEERLVVVQEVERTWLRKVDIDEVKRAIRKAVVQEYDLQVYAIALIRTGSLPKTSSGKIQRRGCRAKFLEGSLEILG
ncbi:Putative fatty-acid--CoA ligase (Acyl-CoA synthetase) [Microcystis aeruginosa PCC 9432]|jgi:acyl-CoA synthetase (AMP-forming)/AMP-acid ligase II|uniref:Fatty-acid--CoA ligase (Acyl-CoA synthetase) n=1 Tax=Microcystis aeruginosa PCC 9432 TaxID=1160280 RepID=A0A822L880_MICAE|nr:fatty acyl-AMP ligase [Microcystis aeruginosa]TRT96252.1 MAG: fatty acyl-AMP ligase [Microcystis aeruginosa Ma_OC_LR_19540900_S633]CCH91193.1 Putative fatty-acid--CoA ligase (Acyl-CoA synthetase) [Microcystis aeruginosa PCC 9432]